MAETKCEMSSLDIRFLVRELKAELIGGTFRKIYQYGGKSKQFLFELFVPEKGTRLLYTDKDRIFITERKKPVPLEPPSFCMFLRKHLMGKRIRNIRQYEFDRIVEIECDENILVMEFVPPGNMILCDPSYGVIMPREVQRWKDREILPKRPYRHPPHRSQPFDMEISELSSLARKCPDTRVAAFLAVNLGFGSLYANEICAVAGIGPEILCKSLGSSNLASIHRVIDVIREAPTKPVVYEDAVTPFPLKIMQGKEARPFPTFTSALDEFFSGLEIEAAREEEKKEKEHQEHRIEGIIQRQEEAAGKWKGIEHESREAAEAIYNHYSTVQSVLEGIRKAKDSGLSWDEIKHRITGEDTPEADAIKEIRENDGVVVLDLGGAEVEIDIRKSVEENAAAYYEDAKWAKGKHSGASGAMAEQQHRLDILREKEAEPAGDVETPEQESSEREAPEPKRKWYEDFKWFLSSNGFLVVAGRSAEQNETLLKKHADDRDLVFHADIPGAAFVVIKTQGMDIPDETRKEAAEFSAANSKAWNRGLGTIDIFSVPRSQVTKGDMSLPKGSFLVQGERTWYRNLELKLSVGVRLHREPERAEVIAGPVMAVRKNSSYFVTIKPGFKKSLELARTIKNKLLIKSRPEDKVMIENLSLDDFQRVMPAGMGEVTEYG
jgi:predicted ribosome quality control (RQC) complex YloA/Tae2 family protein